MQSYFSAAYNWTAKQEFIWMKDKAYKKKYSITVNPASLVPREEELENKGKIPLTDREI